MGNSAAVLMVAPIFEDDPKVAGVERIQEIQILPAKTAPESFAVGIRGRRPRRRAENAQSEPLDRVV